MVGGYDEGMNGSSHGQGVADRGRLAVVLGITVTLLAAEVVGALLTGSLALLADAGHVLTDAGGITLALLAARFAVRPPTTLRSFGYQRLEILAAVANAVLLLGVAGFVVTEAWRRLQDPPEVAAAGMLGVALLGLAGNGVSLWMLHGGSRRSLNLRGAHLEVLGDLLGSAAAVVAAVVIALTGSYVADPVASLLIAALIVPRTVMLLREAVEVLLEATPRRLDAGHVRDHILSVPGVVDVHDLHVWTITNGMDVISAHVVLEHGVDGCAALDELGRCLSGHFDIEHSTFQLEAPEHRHHEGATHP
jgi:cobalt-zinc-cadmium efflux system protein